MNTKEGYAKLKLLNTQYLLLAGGGHKAISDFAPSVTGGYLPLSGGTMLEKDESNAVKGVTGLILNSANGIALKFISGSGIYTNIKPLTLTSSIDITLPNTAGTLALTSDITKSDHELKPTSTFIDSNWHEVGTYSGNTQYACWSLNGNSSNLGQLTKGSYLLLIDHSVDLNGGLYTGIFSYSPGGSATNDEIILHRSGTNEHSNQCLFARIKYINETNGVCLQLCGILQETDCTQLTIKIKKLL